MLCSLVHPQKHFLFFQYHWEEHTLQTHHQSSTNQGSLALHIHWHSAPVCGWTTPPAFPDTALATHSRDTRIQEPGPMTCAHTASLFSRLADLLLERVWAVP